MLLLCFHEGPISPPFSQSFGRPWSILGPLLDAFGTPLGLPWAHLGPPLTPQTTPWAHPGRPLADPRGPDRKTLEKGLAGPDLPEPFWHPKSCFFCYTFSPVAFMHFEGPRAAFSVSFSLLFGGLFGYLSSVCEKWRTLRKCRK